LFGFEPMVAAYNILDLARPLLVIAGFIAMLGLLFRGQILSSLATLLAVALLYFTFQPGILENLGASTAKILTIETGVISARPEQYESDKPNEETTGEPDEAPPEEQTQPDSLFQH
jgi:hypothetical protein